MAIARRTGWAFTCDRCGHVSDARPNGADCGADAPEGARMLGSIGLCVSCTAAFEIWMREGRPEQRTRRARDSNKGGTRQGR